MVLNKPTGEGTSKVYWEIGNSAVPDPTELSNVYISQIPVSASQTIKGRVVDAAGNVGAVGTFAYQIGPSPQHPPSVRPREHDAGRRRDLVAGAWRAARTGYSVYRNDLKVNATRPSTATSFINTQSRTG